MSIRWLQLGGVIVAMCIFMDEKEIIETVLRNNETLPMPGIAKLLGVGLNTLHRRMRQHGIAGRKAGRKVGGRGGYRRAIVLPSGQV